jgi:hypothetical protein
MKSLKFALLVGIVMLLSQLSAEVVEWDVSQLNLVTPASLGDDVNLGNTAIGVWFNVESGEAYVVEDTAGIPGKTDIADGRFQLRWTTYWTLGGGLPSSDILVQGELPFNAVLGIATATPSAAAGSPARLGVNESVPTGAAFVPVNFIEMAGTFGVWNGHKRGFLGLRFLAGEGSFNLHFGYADVSLLADGRTRLNGIAFNSLPNQTLTTSYIGAPAPAAARQLLVASATTNTISLEWEDVSDGETGFRVERRQAEDEEFIEVAFTLPDETRFTDSNLSAGVSYVYRVVATTGIDAEPSNLVEVTTQSVDSAPVAPQLLNAEPLSPASIRLEWIDASNNELTFRIEREDPVGWLSIATVPAGTETFVDTGLTQGTGYRYRVVAGNGSDSLPSGSAFARTFSPRETVGLDLLIGSHPYLLGNGVEIGLWDFAPALSTHREFANGDVENREGGDAGSNVLSNHTTHGTGIITASGINPLARGIAPEASVKVYLFDEDQIEKRAIGMEWPGQPDRLQVAVSAYGPIRGWNPVSGGAGKWTFNADQIAGQPPQVDPFFGAYTSFSRQADETAWLRPYLVQIRSAGNDRDDVPAPGDFVFLSNEDFNANVLSVYRPELDAPVDGSSGGYFIVSDAAAAKNTLTVGPWSGANRDGLTGAIETLGPEPSFGNWGPTLDGRIKPDLVAPGVNILSAGYASPDAYSTLTGSSQAAPHVAAVAGLLVQHWQQAGLFGALRASTLKGILLHSADDIAPTGPDPSTGWGLLNAFKAIELIDQHIENPAAGHLLEGYISADPVQKEYRATGGPVKVTLVWTDPPSQKDDDATPHLVYDLDLRVRLQDGRTYFPYVLLSPQPAGRWAASKGDNSVDPVEQVLTDPLEGPIEILISSKGALPETLPFSLIVEGAVSMESAAPRLTRVNVTGETVQILGDGIQLGCSLRLHHESGLEVLATGVESSFNGVVARFPDGPPVDGYWRATVVNPSGQSGFIRWWQGPGVPDDYVNSFEAWLDLFLGDGPDRSNPYMAATNSDPDKDGYSQLMAFAFGATSGKVPSLLQPRLRPVLIDNVKWLELEYTRRIGTDLNLSFAFSLSPDGPWTQPEGMETVSTTPAATAGLEEVLVRWPNPDDLSGFVRFQASF